MDRNLPLGPTPQEGRTSPPARVAWIEMYTSAGCGRIAEVATREGGVDRNKKSTLILRGPESVATREGGVDRNVFGDFGRVAFGVSPPARVAWIEIVRGGAVMEILPVATREGGVDRNTCFLFQVSLAAVVATREGGVDRNTVRTVKPISEIRRHPRGWRG